MYKTNICVILCTKIVYLGLDYMVRSNVVQYMIINYTSYTHFPRNIQSPFCASLVC